MAQIPAVSLLSHSELLVIQAITDGTYFVNNVTPTGTVNGVNAVFTLPSSPNPAASLDLRVNGSSFKAGGTDYTLVGSTITFVVAPPTGSILLASFTVSPV